MHGKCRVMTFNYSCTPVELEAMALDFAAKVKPVTEGLIWKIFLNRPEEHRSAGVYLFRDVASASNYLNGPFVKAMRESLIITNISAEVFEVMHQASINAHAPVESIEDKFWPAFCEGYETLPTNRY